MSRAHGRGKGIFGLQLGLKAKKRRWLRDKRGLQEVSEGGRPTTTRLVVVLVQGRRVCGRAAENERD
jgi:hypothetical protein